MRYLVGIDGLRESRQAFDAALQDATTNDYLLLVSVVDPPIDDSSSSLSEQQMLEEAAFHSLTLLGEVCLSKCVPYSLLVAAESHPGKLFCDIAVEQHIDLIVLGRRRMSSFQRVFTASTSKYCLEHAYCSVLVVKRALPAKEEKNGTTPCQNAHRVANDAIGAGIFASLQPLSVEHGTLPLLPEIPRSDFSTKLELAHQLQEAEWQKYLKENHLKAEESRGNLELTKLIEEKERQIRINEIQEAKTTEKEERAHLLLHVKNLEEQERQLRMSNGVDSWPPNSNRSEDIVYAAKQADELRDTISTNDDALDMSSYDSREERLRRLRKVKIDEEIERRRRIQEMNNNAKAEREKQAEASKADLEAVKMFEESERQRRVKHHEKENMREAMKERVQSYKDLQVVKELEEKERIRRISEMGWNSRLRDPIQLEKVKQMEEEERYRRTAECEGESGQRKDDFELVKCLEETERLRRTREGGSTTGGDASV